MRFPKILSFAVIILLGPAYSQSHRLYDEVTQAEIDLLRASAEYSLQEPSVYEQTLITYEAEPNNNGNGKGGGKGGGGNNQPPIPEPETYGFLFISSLLMLFAFWKRRIFHPSSTTQR